MAIWTVPATVVRVVDADTIRLKLDLGWGISSEQNCRIIGVNAPELSTAAGQAARDWALTIMTPGLPVTFTSHKLDKYGRPLGQVHYGPAGAVDYGTTLLAAGHAVVMI